MTNFNMSNLFTNTTKAAIDDISKLVEGMDKDEAIYCEILESNLQRLRDEYGTPSVACAVIVVAYGEDTLIELLSLAAKLSNQ